MRGSSPPAGAIVNSASDIFTVTGSQYSARFENCTFTSNTGGGHIWNAVHRADLGHWTITGCYLTQNNAAKSIWNQNGGFLYVLVNGNTPDMLVKRHRLTLDGYKRPGARERR